MKNAVGGLLSRLDAAEERIMTENIHQWKLPKLKFRREIRMKTNVISKVCGTILKGITFVLFEYYKNKEGSRRNILSNNGQKCSKINDKHQATEPGSSEGTKQDKCQNIF